MKYRPCTYRVSAKALVVDQKGLLLVREDSEHWDLPGGGVEHFEDPLNALSREVEEEVGLKVLDAYADRLQAWATYDLEHDRPLLFLVYPVALSAGDPHTEQADCEFSYFTESELETLAIEPHLEKFRKSMVDALRK